MITIVLSFIEERIHSVLLQCIFEFFKKINKYSYDVSFVNVKKMLFAYLNVFFELL